MTIYPFIVPFFGGGGAIILGGASMMRQAAAERRKYAVVQTKAKIIERVITIEKTPCFVYEFLVDGLPQRAEFTGRMLWRKGDIVSIFYDPKRPNIIYIPGVFHWIKIFALYAVGIIWLLISAVMLIFWWLGVQ